MQDAERNKRISGFEKYQICITCHKKYNPYPNESSSAINNQNSALICHFENQESLEEDQCSAIGVIQYANLICEAQEEHINQDEQRKEESTKPFGAKLGEEYANKAALMKSMSIYALKENFQYKVKESYTNFHH